MTGPTPCSTPPKATKQARPLPPADSSPPVVPGADQASSAVRRIYQDNGKPRAKAYRDSGREVGRALRGDCHNRTADERGGHEFL